jgi:UDP-glucose 4-epimerase
MRPMRALVTGGAGFIGSNLVDALLDRGDEVSVIDNLSTGREVNLTGALERGAVLHRADIREPDTMNDLVARDAPDAIFHLAAQIDVRHSVADPAHDARINVEGTCNMLEAARRAGTGRFVMTSTGGAIYGETDLLPTPESTPPKPEAPYGMSKFCAERYVDLYERLFSLSAVTLRLGNVYGPRQDPLGEAGVIAIYCGCLRDGRTPIVYGDGTQTRDYVYVGDVVAANLAALEHADVRGEFNIGHGIETSVLDLVEVMSALAGQAGFEPAFEPARLGEVQRSCLDVSRARSELGWEPTTDLRTGLELTLAAASAESRAV